MDARIEDALSRMTLEEKIAMIHAQSNFTTPGVPRLGIPEIMMTDGPHGVNKELETFTETALVESIISLVKTSSLNLRYFNFEDMRILKNIMLFLNNRDIRSIHTQNILQFNGCGNRIYQYSFTPEGEIYPCSPSIGNRELSIGRYIPQLSMEYPLNKAWTFKHEYSSTECSTCNMAFLCGGGCKYSILKEGLNTKECDSVRKLFPAFIECMENNIDLVNNETVYEKV